MTARRPIPLWGHVVALAVVLVGVGLLVDRPLVGYFSDEGAAIIEVRVLQATHHWTIADPTARLDPGGTARPIPYADVGAKGRAAYGKHPLYPLVLLGADGLAGVTGMIGVSIAGVLLAGLASALIARRMAAALAAPTLWLVGIGSPLLFDANLILAHALAAALAGGAALAAIATVQGGTRWKSVAVLLGCAAAVLLRTEGLAFSVALALGALAVAGGRRRVPALMVAAAALVGAGAARIGESVAVRSILGAGGHAQPLPGAASGFITARVDAARETLLRPAISDNRLAALLVVGLLGCLVAAVAVRLGRDARVVAAASGGAVSCYLIWLFAGRPAAIPGLLVAWPVLAAVICLRRADLRDPAMVVLAVTSLLFAAAVVATEYAAGGGLEWGGRYFAIGLPVAAPVVVAGLMKSRVLAGGLLAVMVVVAILAVAELRDVRAITRQLEAQVHDCGARAGASGSPALDDRPLVVSANQLFPQLDWRQFFRYAWLAPAPGHLAGTWDTMRTAGVRRFVLVDATPVTDLASSGYRPTWSCGPGVTATALISAGTPG